VRVRGPSPRPGLGADPLPCPCRAAEGGGGGQPDAAGERAGRPGAGAQHPQRPGRPRRARAPEAALGPGGQRCRAAEGAGAANGRRRSPGAGSAAPAWAGAGCEGSFILAPSSSLRGDGQLLCVRLSAPPKAGAGDRADEADPPEGAGGQGRGAGGRAAVLPEEGRSAPGWGDDAGCCPGFPLSAVRGAPPLLSHHQAGTSPVAAPGCKIRVWVRHWRGCWGRGARATCDAAHGHGAPSNTSITPRAPTPASQGFVFGDKEQKTPFQQGHKVDGVQA